MYADSQEPTLLSVGNGLVNINNPNNIEAIPSSMVEEKTGLLQRNEP